MAACTSRTAFGVIQQLPEASNARLGCATRRFLPGIVQRRQVIPAASTASQAAGFLPLPSVWHGTEDAEADEALNEHLWI